MKLTRPTLIIDPEKTQKNLRAMTEKARQHNLIFRPHFKTHQSQAIGRWFAGMGIDKITVSSAGMAEYFAADGWKDITIAFPMNINEASKINELAGRVSLNATILNHEAIDSLNRVLQHPVGVFLKIDTGARRTGISHEYVDTARQLKESIDRSANLHLKGLLTHAGHTYHAGSREEIHEIHEQTRDRLVHLRQELEKGDEKLFISVGDTPSCTLADEFEGIDEIRPGNFIFFDLQQHKLNVCSIDEISVILACPVVAKHKERGRIIVYGGAVHLSKDTFTEGSTRIYGYGMILHEEGWVHPEEKIIVEGLSQEHGILNVTPYMMKRISIGDFVGILPAHSCLTANLMGGYYDMQGNFYDHINT